MKAFHEERADKLYNEDDCQASDQAGNFLLHDWFAVKNSTV